MGTCPSATTRLSPGLHRDRGKECPRRMGSIVKGDRHRRRLSDSDHRHCTGYLEDPHALHSLSKTGQTGARGTRSTSERKSLPNDRGASARLTHGPECNALIRWPIRVTQSVLPRSATRRQKKQESERNILTQWGSP